MTFYRWSRTAAANATADPTCPFPEGQAPGSVNDGVRAAMAALAKYRDDVAGSLTTGGSATAYTLASNQGFNSLANLSGQIVAFVAHTANGPAATLNVDGLGAKPLRIAPGTALPSGYLRAGMPYVATYVNGANEFLLTGLFANPYEVPLGGLIPYAGPNNHTVPNANFALPNGQAISRSTHAAYFALVGTLYGAGDGATTFNVIDLRGRAPFGKDDMGGSAASRVTSATVSPNGSTIGATGGAQTVTIGQTNLPSYNLNTNLSVGTSLTNGDTILRGSSIVNNVELGGGTSDVRREGQNVTLTLASGTVSGTVNLGGGGNALNKMPPAMIVTYLLRVL
jgi:microcystin-dependent protein